MKPIAIACALACTIAVPALADQLGGISGIVVDATTGQAVAHARLYYYRAPYRENGPNQVMQLDTNNRGFFSDITLEPGRYVIMAQFPGRFEGCAVDDVMGGEVARVRIEMGRSALMCSGPRVHSALVDPNATSSVYRI